MKIAISQITRDPECQPRHTLNVDTIAEYAEARREGATFPPATVFTDGTTYWLADGFHRVAAAEIAGLVEIDADVKPGTLRDAMLHAVGANATHGLRRTNADKRRAVEALLNDDEWQEWSDREIARRCGVTHPFVARVRAEVSGNRYHSEGEDSEECVLHPSFLRPMLNDVLSGNGYHLEEWERLSRALDTTAAGLRIKAAAIEGDARGIVRTIGDIERTLTPGQFREWLRIETGYDYGSLERLREAVRDDVGVIDAYINLWSQANPTTTNRAK